MKYRLGFPGGIFVEAQNPGASDVQNPITLETHNTPRPDPGGWKSSGTILVVDDEPMVRFVITTVLAGTGFEVIEAGDGKEGLRLFAEHGDKLRAVLLDLSMPEMDGAETFLEMHRLHPEVPIVLLSGYSERDSLERLSEQGLAGFLGKPFKPMALVAKVREILER